LLALYQDAIAAKRRLLQAAPGMIATANVQQMASTAEGPLHDFRRRSDADYPSGPSWSV